MKGHMIKGEGIRRRIAISAFLVPLVLFSKPLYNSLESVFYDSKETEKNVEERSVEPAIEPTKPANTPEPKYFVPFQFEWIELAREMRDSQGGLSYKVIGDPHSLYPKINLIRSAYV